MLKTTHYFFSYDTQSTPEIDIFLQADGFSAFCRIRFFAVDLFVGPRQTTLFEPDLFVGPRQTTLFEPDLSVGLRTTTFFKPDFFIGLRTTTLFKPDLFVGLRTTTFFKPDLSVNLRTTTLFEPDLFVNLRTTTFAISENSAHAHQNTSTERTKLFRRRRRSGKQENLSAKRQKMSYF
ncbi:MAG: hypothetical protein WAN90_03670 [Dysgonamonadaceae bacterium]